jgi:hypothetical protein
MIGISLVFSAVILEVYENYKEKIEQDKIVPGQVKLG